MTFYQHEQSIVKRNISNYQVSRDVIAIPESFLRSTRYLVYLFDGFSFRLLISSNDQFILVIALGRRAIWPLSARGQTVIARDESEGYYSLPEGR